MLSNKPSLPSPGDSSPRPARVPATKTAPKRVTTKEQKHAIKQAKQLSKKLKRLERRKKKHPVRTALLILSLVIFCIGGTELAVCRVADPALYHRMTDPVYRAMRQYYDQAKVVVDEKVDTVQAWAGEKKEAWDKWRAERSGNPIEEQTAGDPLLPNSAGDTNPNDPTVTELVQRQGQEILTGGSVEIAYFGQGDSRWEDKPFGEDTIGPYGCGPTAMAMAIRSLTDTETDPAQVATWAADNGFWAPKHGSYHSMIPAAAEQFGLNCQSLETLTLEDLYLHLAGGEIAVALMQAGHFTKSGHFILLRGVTLDGYILVADPNSRSRSLQAWNPQIILDELSTANDNGAPLWFLSKPA